MTESQHDGAVTVHRGVEFNKDSLDDGSDGEEAQLLRTEDEMEYYPKRIPGFTPKALGSQPLATGENSPAKNPPKAAIRWRDLPQKKQLLVITLTRLSEPLVQTSLQAYMFYQLRWFDPSLPDHVISGQAGVLHASFTFAQFLTAMMWGRIADSARAGRKTVVLVGLLGTMASCVGFGLSTSFWQALAFRTLGGATNGMVGVLRTMVSEVVRGKRYHAVAFSLLPMTFNIGVIVGPVLGGLLADPAGSYPGVFGGVEFLRRFPYAMPNLVSAFFLLAAALVAWLCLEEVSWVPASMNFLFGAAC